MTITVIICAYTLERWDDLCAAVQSCRDQSLAPQEIVVVIDHNDDLLARARDELTGARVIANASTKGLSGARNTGVVASNGDAIAFLDDDAFADPTWLEELTAPLSDPTVAGVGGWIVPAWPAAAPPWFPETFLWVLGCSYGGLPESGHAIRNPIGANMVFRRRVFDVAGGFSANVGRVGRNRLGCEETELCIRYAAKSPADRFVLRREAVVHHRVPPERLTWHYFWTRCWAEGLSKAAVGSLVGTSAGLSAERAHVARSLPREVLTILRSFPREPRSASVRLGLIVVGTALAVAGVLRGTYALRRAPLTVHASVLSDIAVAGDDSWPPTSSDAD